MSHRGTRRIAVALASLACLAGAGCGARSQLSTPSGAGGDAAVACTNGDFTLTRAKPTIMLVLDHSKSMEDHLGEEGGQLSRWGILRQALAATLPPVDASMAIGALVYPTGIPGQPQGQALTCTVPIAPDLMPATGQVSALIELMQGVMSGSGTPTADAIEVAAAALLGVHAATSARALVLATDGGPNCNLALDPDECQCIVSGKGCKESAMCLDDARTVARIGALLERGLPTYVIGIQDPNDTELTGVLDAMADAGGRAKAGGSQRYYAATSGAELESALAAIRDQVGLCTYLVASVPDSKGAITVRLGETEVPYDETGKDGWRWGNKDNGEIVLFGTACTAAVADGSVTLAAEVRCSAL